MHHLVRPVYLLHITQWQFSGGGEISGNVSIENSLSMPTVERRVVAGCASLSRREPFHENSFYPILSGRASGFRVDNPVHTEQPWNGQGGISYVLESGLPSQCFPHP